MVRKVCEGNRMIDVESIERIFRKTLANVDLSTMEPVKTKNEQLVRR